MEFQVSATTKSTRTKVFVKWNNTQEIMYGARFGKEEQAEQVSCSSKIHGARPHRQGLKLGKKLIHIFRLEMMFE